ncbi:kinase-like domain-containing protein [Scleroderma yunnanense]
MSTSLKQVSQLAASCGINFNGDVSRDESKLDPLTGASAVVHLGNLRTVGKAVAVKTFRFAPLEEEAAAERIIQQAYAWSGLHHKNVLPFIGIVTTFDYAISFITEWIDNGNAYDYVQNPENDPRPLLVDIASGLNYLHNHEKGPIFHGDLRGRNVLVSKDGHALLSDFSLSLLIDASFDTSAAAPIHPTLRWMPPEEIQGCENPTVSSDVWSFGMTALELFTRAPPFHEIQSLRKVLTRILQGPPERPSDKATLFRLTDEWWKVCTLCCAHDPSQRPLMSDISMRLGMPLVTFGPFNGFPLLITLT